MKLYQATILLCLFVVANSYFQSQEALTDVNTYIEQAKQNVNPRYRLSYHVAPPVGWMNDPNGFAYYNGQFHLFYQFYPYDSVWGPMHWGHAVSDDLVNWENLPVALIPEREMCYSGSAVEYEGALVVLYTANVVTETEPFYNQTQYLAYSTNGIDFQKYDGNPVLADPNQPADFRDPKIWKNGEHWYILLGSKTSDGRGNVLLYRTKEDMEWEFINVMAESNGTLGYMWECPDFFELNGKYVLLISPEGVLAQGDRYKNHQNVGYFVGSFDYATHKFTPETEFQELDYGHDFYATQTIEHRGRRLLVAWFSMWQKPHPEDVDGWAGAMTLVRELTLDSNNRLLMNPIQEFETLRNEMLNKDDIKTDETINLGTAAEVLIEASLKKDVRVLFEGVEGGEQFELRWDVDSGKVMLDRGDEDGIRQVEWYPNKHHQWRVFLDTSSVEVFCGDGEVVFSTRVYPLGGWKMTSLTKDQKLKVKAYSLNRSVSN